MRTSDLLQNTCSVFVKASSAQRVSGRMHIVSECTGSRLATASFVPAFASQAVPDMMPNYRQRAAIGSLDEYMIDARGARPLDSKLSCPSGDPNLTFQVEASTGEFHLLTFRIHLGGSAVHLLRFRVRLLKITEAAVQANRPIRRFLQEVIFQ